MPLQATSVLWLEWARFLKYRLIDGKTCPRKPLQFCGLDGHVFEKYINRQENLSTQATFVLWLEWALFSIIY